MYTTCSNLLCGKMFLGEAHAFHLDQPICGECYNKRLPKNPGISGDVLTDEVIKNAIDQLRKNDDLNRPYIPPQYPPPTLG